MKSITPPFPNQLNNQTANFQPSMNDYNPHTNMLQQQIYLLQIQQQGMCSVQPMVNDFNSYRNNRWNPINNIQQRSNDSNFFKNRYNYNNNYNNNYQGIESKKNERLFSINVNNENNIINPNNLNEDSNTKKNKKIKLNILY